jgi:hypothetical protein
VETRAPGCQVQLPVHICWLDLPSAAYNGPAAVVQAGLTDIVVPFLPHCSARQHVRYRLGKVTYSPSRLHLPLTIMFWLPRAAGWCWDLQEVGSCSSQACGSHWHHRG